MLLKNSVIDRIGRMAEMNCSDSMLEADEDAQQAFSSASASHNTYLLHGNLDIWVNNAKNLPNMDLLNKNLGNMLGRMSGKLKHKKETSDPYVVVVASSATLARTFVLKNNENPVWEQHFYVPVAHYCSEVQFVVKDSDIVGSEFIGAIGLPVDLIYSGDTIEGTFPLLNANRKPFSRGSVLSLSIQYVPFDRLWLYRNGVGSDMDHQGVPGTYFPIRKGGTVTLYQDAHVHEDKLPSLDLANGTMYKHNACWRDIFNAIHEAHRLIYITGWSVVHLVQLVREDPNVPSSSLGELLRVKSQEGVRVLLLLWDDPTSTTVLGYRTEGVMGTGDHDTRRFFKHSSVNVLLCPRSSGKGSWAQKKEAGTIYTHHQKSVIVDAESDQHKRKLVAFIGGLDLTTGRYDTPQHPLFSTLDTIHKEDYHNPNFVGPTTGCPREPWHDLHCRIDGPAAYDVLKNFEERWCKASSRHVIKKLKASYDDALLKLDRIRDIESITESSTISEDDPEAWNIQVFRSIDSNSVRGFPKDPQAASKLNLVCGKNSMIDMSIHTAYIKAIRSAQHYIYIENQYFLGSSYNWDSCKDLGANNLIPMEIALKITNKIRAGERFAAYIVIPMWPEGNPTSTPTQRILYWQNKTMQMMYDIIYKALVEAGLNNEYDPEDYLNFFCLGNREPNPDGSETKTSKGSNATSPQSLSKKNRRFMIYVHSKGMIVDDEYVIIGSANINQRSLEGTRDTEITMGAYQPHYTWANKEANPRGQIFGYRMSLWAEHTGACEKVFEDPESLECVRRMKWMGERNWKRFESPEISEMHGHLLKYPVQVDITGKVRSLPGCETFPDMGGKITGTFTGIQENLTI